MNGTWTLSPMMYRDFFSHRMVYEDGEYIYTEYMTGVKPRHIRRAKRSIKRSVRRHHARAEAIRAFNEAKEH